jgi:glycosyltransferase involved in cell wall biosynthesis
MPTLTIFTPAYNRAHLLPRLYESLCRQTCKDFCWLIIDDGSQDNTHDIVMGWISEGRIPIRYEHKENGGMHTAHNLAYQLIGTELNTCIDSDDFMPDDAVELITTFWKDHGSNSVAGIVGLDVTANGQIIGSTFPEAKDRVTLTDFYHFGGRGDKKLVYRTALMKALPKYPEFEGEKYVGLGYKYLLADLQQPLLTLNKPLVVVEYQPDGSSNTMWQQYGRHPQGFAFLRRETMNHHPYFKERFKAAIHHISSCLYLHRNPFRDSPKPIMTAFAIIPGLLVHLLIRYKSS